MHEPVDDRHRGHRILEDLIPLAEDQGVRGDDDRFLFVALGEEGEEHLQLIAGLLHIADVVEDHVVEALELGEGPGSFRSRLAASNCVTSLKVGVNNTFNWCRWIHSRPSAATKRDLPIMPLPA